QMTFETLKATPKIFARVVTSQRPAQERLQRCPSLLIRHGPALPALEPFRHLPQRHEEVRRVGKIVRSPSKEGRAEIGRKGVRVERSKRRQRVEAQPKSLRPRAAQLRAQIASERLPVAQQGGMARLQRFQAANRL